MSVCSICIDTLKSPVALPCGHVYCHECVIRTIQAIRPYTTQHSCPTCRSPYSIVNIDPTLVPSYLRQNLTPSIRRLYLESPQPQPNIPTSTIIESARVNAENAALRVHCGMWRRRAEVHAAATLGLLGLARMARDHAIQMKYERDELQKQYHALKRKYEDEEPKSELLSSSLPFTRRADSLSPPQPSGSQLPPFPSSGLSTTPSPSPPPPVGDPVSAPRWPPIISGEDDEDVKPRIKRRRKDLQIISSNSQPDCDPKFHSSPRRSPRNILG